MEDNILHDCRVKTSVIKLGISAGTVTSINHAVLMKSKVSSRWVPQMLTPEQKACRQKFIEENLDMLRANPETFFSRIITRDETWVHHHDPENKRVLAMETQGVSYSQEMSCAAIRRKDHGNSFLGL